MNTRDTALLTRWTAVFVDDEQEAAYRRSTLPLERTTMRAAIVIVLIVDVLSLLIGKLVAHHPTTVAEFVVQTVSVATAVALYPLLGRVGAERWRLWVAVCGLVLILAIAAMVAFGQDMAYRGGLLIPPSILVIYLVVRLDLRTLVGLAVVDSMAMFCAWLSTLEQPRPSEATFLFTLILLANGLGFVESRRMQRERRLVFAQEQVLTRHATQDDLTGLANRRHFYETADAHLRQQRTSRLLQETAIMLVDLDRFKEINDTLGHHTGDVLLQQIAARMRATLPAALVLARLGGDEFAALLVGRVGADHVNMQAQRFLVSLDEPFELDGLTLHIHASIGIAMCQDGEDRPALLRQADIAMYRSKTRGGGIDIYTPSDLAHTREQVQLASELSLALKNEEILLHYQPKMDIRSGQTTSVEALIRWQHPVHGLLPPARFLPVAERHGLMRMLTLRVLALALQQAQQWLAAGRQLRIAVNIAPESLLDARFPDLVLELLERSSVPASALQLEITENTILVDPDRMLQVIKRLGAAGFKFALDDYGTGYSSLSYLSVMPLDELKIDCSFVSSLASDASNAVIVRSTIQMARELGLHVVAEGVEDEATFAHLSRFGCDTAQGYYLSRPVPPAALEAWLDERAGATHHGPQTAAPMPAERLHS
ncbi:MAG: EAL domain-containing protein [Rubrivivax sp.]|nr:EAL domain-containing protein [Rubrivivax sp.]